MKESECKLIVIMYETLFMKSFTVYYIVCILCMKFS